MVKVDGAATADVVQSTLPHYNALDGIRGVAATWVLVGHVFQQSLLGGPFLWLPIHNGFAVDLFMIMSGFLMFKLHGERVNFNTIQFWVRRVFRLAPLYWFILIVSLFSAPAFMAARTTLEGFNHFDFSTWPLVSGWVPAVEHALFIFGLIPAISQSSAMPDWSLSLEAQFYFVFPGLVFLSRRIGVASVLVGALCLQFLILYAFRGYFGLFHFHSALPIELNLFLAGIAFAVPRLKYALIGVLLASIASTSMIDVLIRVFLGILILACTQQKRRDALLLNMSNAIVWPFRLPFTRWLGEISYPIYLTHIIILTFSMDFFIKMGLTDKRILGLTTLSATLVITLAVAQVLHLLVEIPGIALGRSIERQLFRRSVKSTPFVTSVES